MTRSLLNAGHVLGRLGRWTEARESLAEGEERSIRELGPTHPNVRWALHELAQAHRALKDSEGLAEVTGRLLDLERASREPDDPEVLKTLRALALSYQLLDRHAEAEKLLLEAFDSAPTSMQQQLRVDLRVLYQAMGRPEDAAKW